MVVNGRRKVASKPSRASAPDRAKVVQRRARAYARETGAATRVLQEIDELLGLRKTKHPSSNAWRILASKRVPIEKHQVLQYWIFDGLPLSTRLVYYFGVLEGLYSIPENLIGRWNEFADFMDEFHAREQALNLSRDVGGWLFGGEPEFLWSVGKRAAREAGDFCEMGSWLGRSSTIWCHVLRKFAPEKKLHVLDDWKWGYDAAKYPFMASDRDVYREFAANIPDGEAQYRVYQGLIQDTALQCKQHLGDGLALIFHDASHAADEVEQDLDQFVPFLNVGAFLLVHDFAHPDFPGARSGVEAVCRRYNWLKFEHVVNTIGVFRRVDNA